MDPTLSRQKQEQARKKPRPQIILPPSKLVLLAAVPIGLLVYYLAWVAPSLVPVPPDVKVPYPAATRFLEDVCAWSGEHPWVVVLFGLGVLVSGLFSRFVTTVDRYYLLLAVLASLTLGFTYLSISAPIDRLLHAIENAVPKDNRVPNHRAQDEE